jgi:DNA-3-methyladenine glycosylase II
MKKAGVKHISKADRTLARHIKRVGPFELKVEAKINPFEALMSSIVYQQLNGKAASTILGRVVALCPGKRFPRPEDILSLPDEKLRAAGLSRNKTLAVKDLAQKTLDGVVPTSRAIQKMSDDEIIERLVEVRGIGRWTVEMFLIKMGREDILPTTDYGIQQGFKLVYKKRKLPTPKALALYGERWRPYRTVASWYLWRALDF